MLYLQTISMENGVSRNLVCNVAMFETLNKTGRMACHEASAGIKFLLMLFYKFVAAPTIIQLPYKIK